MSITWRDRLQRAPKPASPHIVVADSSTTRAQNRGARGRGEPCARGGGARGRGGWGARVESAVENNYKRKTLNHLQIIRTKLCAIERAGARGRGARGAMRLRSSLANFVATAGLAQANRDLVADELATPAADWSSTLDTLLVVTVSPNAALLAHGIKSAPNSCAGGLLLIATHPFFG